MMIDKDIDDLLKVSEMELFNRSIVSEAYKVVADIEEELDDFMRRANDRFIGGSRYIPVGFNFSVGNVMYSRGQGFFDSHINVNIAIPYCKLERGLGVSEQEKEVYRQYNLSIFKYKIVLGKYVHEVQKRLRDTFAYFMDKDLSVKRPIGFAIQQISSYIPQPSLQGFSSNYQYIGIVIYEEIYKDRFTFLLCTHQIRVGERPECAVYWQDGRKIGTSFEEDIKKFQEDEGILFDRPMIIMYPGGGAIVQLIPEDPGQRVAARRMV